MYVRTVRSPYLSYDMRVTVNIMFNENVKYCCEIFVQDRINVMFFL